MKMREFDPSMFMGDYHLQARLQKIISQMPLSVQTTLSGLYKCGTIPIASKQQAYFGERVGVDIMMNRYSNGKRRAWFKGLMTCHNSWVCPVCGMRRMVLAREKLNIIIENMKNDGFAAVMVTLTIPHHKKQSAAEVYGNLRQALVKWQNVIQRYKKTRVHIESSVTSTECMYSSFNGWHFHLHVLYFIPIDELSQFFDDEIMLRNRWLKIIDSIGLPRNFHGTEKGHALGLFISKTPRSNADYLVKELVKVVKPRKTHGNFSGRYPLELLASENPRDNERYIELALATKGYSRIHCGHGLLKRYDIDTDAIKKNICEETGCIETQVVCSFTLSDWYEIMGDEDYHCGERNHRRGLLLAAELDGLSGILYYCETFGLPYPVWDYVREKRLQLPAGRAAPTKQIVEADEIITEEEWEERQRNKQQFEEFYNSLWS